MDILSLFRKIFRAPVQPAEVPTIPDVPPGDLGATSIIDMYRKEVDVTEDRHYLIQLYTDMEKDEIIGAVLDAYAEEATQRSYENDKIVWIHSDSEDIKNFGEEFLDKIKCDYNVFSLVRTIAWYGYDFELVVGDFGKGILELKPLDLSKIERVEESGILKGFQFTGGSGSITYQPWDIIHFRNLSRKRTNIYGDSILYSARKIWKKLQMIEDAVIIYRLRRHPDRLVFYIDTGKASPVEQLKIINRWKQALRKSFYVKDSTIRQEIRIFAADEDLFFPKAEGNNSSIDVLKGSSNVGDIYDLEYFLNKLFGALKVPKAYFGFEGEINAKASLVQQDIRFARSVAKLQTFVMEGLATAFQIDLIYRGIDPTDPAHSFKFRMVPVSYLEEMARQEIYDTRIKAMQDFSSLFNSLEITKEKWVSWVFRNLGGFTEEETAFLLSGVEKEEVSAEEVAGESLSAEDSRRLKKALSSTPKGRSIISELNEILAKAGSFSSDKLLRREHLGLMKVNKEEKPLVEKTNGNSEIQRRLKYRKEELLR